ncbi:hypothetical protein V3C99_003840 [Haemonchus contortus]
MSTTVVTAPTTNIRNMAKIMTTYIGVQENVSVGESSGPETVTVGTGPTGGFTGGGFGSDFFGVSLLAFSSVSPGGDRGFSSPSTDDLTGTIDMEIDLNEAINTIDK